MDPHNHEENGWRSFNGEFRTNFMLPNFIGFGNGITRGFGSIFSLNHPNNLEFQNSLREVEDYTIEKINEDDNAISCVTINDAPVINNRKKKKRFKSIAVEKIPNKGFGEAINDRLLRASKF